VRCLLLHLEKVQYQHMKTPFLLDTLDSGLTVIRAPMAGVASITVLAIVGTGSRFETVKTSGISHFLEHMVFKGTTRFPTARGLASTVDAIGAEFNAFTSKEYTGYYVKADSSHMNLALDVVSDMLLQPLLREEDIEREKGVIVEEIHMYEDTPTRFIGDVFERLMFAGSGLGRDIIGTEETVRGFNRDTFLHHLNAWYGLKNVVVVVAGDELRLTSKHALDEVIAAFGKHSDTRTTQRTSFYANKLTTTPISTGNKLAIQYKDTQQAHFVLSFPGIARSDERKYAMSILSTLLGGNMSSRLFTEVREKRGLCYYVRSEDDHYHDCGTFGASAGVDPGRVDEAIKVIKEQLLLLTQDQGDHAISDDEVANAISHTVGSTILSLEDSQTVASFYGGQKLLNNEIETPQEKLAKLRLVTRDEVVSLAQQLIDPTKLFFAIIGPYKDTNHFETLIYS